jgi:hypothetical protein
VSSQAHNAPRANAVKVRHAFNALHSGTEGLSAFPVFLLEVLEDEAWREVAHPDGGTRHFKTPKDWMMALPPAGLAAESVDQVRRLVVGTPAELPLRDALKDKDGPKPAELTDNVSKSRTTPTGNSRAYLLDRLARDRPDLKQRVDRGELTPNKAAIEAGFRPRTFTVRADSVQSIAATLRRQLDDNALRELTALLQHAAITVRPTVTANRAHNLR